MTKENYYKDGNALFVVLIDGDDYSENAKAVVGDVRDLLSSYEVEYGGTTIEKQSLHSISAILQLALSIDYSIVLLHAYRREKENLPDNTAAMKAAIYSVVKPVSASALTTIVGLLALLFMSFRIGFDIGIVLMKGIVISAITSLTLLPALVLLLDKRR